MVTIYTRTTNLKEIQAFARTAPFIRKFGPKIGELFQVSTEAVEHDNEKLSNISPSKITYATKTGALAKEEILQSLQTYIDKFDNLTRTKCYFDALSENKFFIACKLKRIFEAHPEIIPTSKDELIEIIGEHNFNILSAQGSPYQKSQGELTCEAIFKSIDQEGKCPIKLEHIAMNNMDETKEYSLKLRESALNLFRDFFEKNEMNFFNFFQSFLNDFEMKVVRNKVPADTYKNAFEQRYELMQIVYLTVRAPEFFEQFSNYDTHMNFLHAKFSFERIKQKYFALETSK